MYWDKCQQCWCLDDKKISYWDLCDSWECTPNALVLTPNTCPDCWEYCDQPMRYITPENLKTVMWIDRDDRVIADINDNTPWTLDDKLSVEYCITKRIDSTNANDHKVVLWLNKDCLWLKLTDLVDWPEQYAHCDKVNNEEDESGCWCDTSSCWSWILTSKCDNSWRERKCPWQSCPNNTIETNYDWHSNKTQFFWWTNWSNPWLQFLCPKKKFIAKIKRDDLQLSEQFDNNKILYSAPDWYAAKVLTNMSDQVVIYDSWIWTDIWWTEISWTSFYVVQVRIPHSNYYELWQWWSCLVNRWIHTIRHQIMSYKTWYTNPKPLLDFRMEWTIFKRSSLTADTFIWVDDINDLNRFSDMTNDLTVSWDSPPELKMDAWLWRTLRWHWFWQTTIEWLEKDDILFFAYKVQTFPVWEEEWCTFWQIAYVWDWPTWTNWAWAWLQRFVRELDEYWARLESEQKSYTLASDL